jgi:hypothetical protein
VEHTSRRAGSALSATLKEQRAVGHCRFGHGSYAGSNVERHVRWMMEIAELLVHKTSYDR